MMQWQQFKISVPDELVAELSEFLEQQGALSVTLSDAGDHPVFGEQLDERPLWPTTELTALFEDTHEAVTTLISQLPPACQTWIHTATWTTLDEQDWVRETQRHFPAQEIAPSVWVLPSWAPTEDYSGQIIRIDPGLAFGTGTHATTRLCLQWLGKHPPQGQRVIDYGCGSGILALTALALGATEVHAIDHDPQALQATEQNAQLNPFVTKTNLIITTGDETVSAAALVIANILSSVLVSLKPILTKATQVDGTLLLSGILNEEYARIIEAFQPEFHVREMARDEEWCAVALTRALYP